ncbi:hypothetical protein EOM33_05765 [Candidatus Saccharibacteria bacterium]|nr:hypothetical protein [Candidatus Saccharibacteria bacterium]
MPSFSFGWNIGSVPSSSNKVKLTEVVKNQCDQVVGLRDLEVAVKAPEGLWCPGTASVSISGWTDLESDDLISAVQSLVQQIELEVNGALARKLLWGMNRQPVTFCKREVSLTARP